MSGRFAGPLPVVLWGRRFRGAESGDPERIRSERAGCHHALWREPWHIRPVAFSEKTANDLEWAALLERVAGHCQSERGAQVILELRPADSLGAARAKLEETREALELVEVGEPLPRVAPGPLDHLLDSVERGLVASGRELKTLVILLVDARKLRVHMASRKDSSPQLFACLSTPRELDQLLVRLDEAIDADGSVADAASPALAKARKQVRAVRSELSKTLRKVAQRLADVLRDGTPVERDGRLTLAVRADAHYPVDGIVLGSSGSGGTLYVEPRETTALGNRLRVVLAEVEREEARILGELSVLVARQFDDVRAAFDACCKADSLGAIVRWASSTTSRYVALEDAPRLKLNNMRHPLLIGAVDEVVPNNLRLEAAQGLIISGPNAGGKTVALKAMGLAIWMARAGLPLPVDEGSKLGWFGQVLTDIGDSQSLELSLSTFSGQVTNLVRMLKMVNSETLVILDELAAGTDPDEGSALAQALLEELVARGASAVVATHYERLEQLGEENPSFYNASVGFDFDTLRPTFHLYLDRPGASAALEVAKRYGLPESVVARARVLMPKTRVEREELLTRLETEQSALTKAREAVENEASQAAKLRTRIESERRVARRDEQQRLAKETRDLTTAVKEARAHLDHAKSRLRQRSIEPAELKTLEKQVAQAGKLVTIGSPLQNAAKPAHDQQGGGSESSSAAAISAAEIKPGMTVQVTTLGAAGKVLSAPQKGRVQVQVGALKTSVSIDALALPGSKPPGTKPVPVGAAPKPSAKTAARRTSSFRDSAPPVAVRTEGNTCDLRGMRVDEALSRVDAHLDLMLSEGQAAGFVLHGHGTGALRAAVRQHLDGSPYVQNSRAAETDEGGDAFSVFWLKG